MIKYKKHVLWLKPLSLATVSAGTGYEAPGKFLDFLELLLPSSSGEDENSFIGLL